MPLADCPAMVLDAVGIVCLTLLVAGTWLLVELAFLHPRGPELAACALTCVVLGTFGTVLRDVFSVTAERVAFRGALGAWLAGVPLAAIVALLLVSTLVEAALAWQFHVLRRASVDVDSVKEALDALPDALLYLDADGHLLLHNARAVELALGPQSTDGLETDAQGRTWQLTRTRLELGERVVDEFVATDVSEEYALVRELEARNRRLGEVNVRLRTYGTDLARLTREEELLAARVHVHDEMGRALVALRAFERQNPEERNRAALLALWGKTLRLFEAAGEEERPTDDWVQLCEAASAIGVQLELTGALPDAEASPEARRLVVTVVHECLNNAVRHADAHELRVCCTCGDGRVACAADAGDGRAAMPRVTLTVTNDGTPPAAPAAETGGLATLRTALERTGGTLVLTWLPTFTLRATLPL